MTYRCEEMEVSLLDAVATEVANWQLKPLVRKAAGLVDRGLLASCWQKAIRRGDCDVASNCARAIWSIDSGYAWRRIRIIALEDVSIGDAGLVAQILAIAGKRKLQAQIGEERLLNSLTVRLARATKSRTACDLVSWASAHHGADSYRAQMATILSEAILDFDLLALWQRAAILQLIAGHTTQIGQHFKVISRPSASARDRLLASWDLPPLVRYVVEKGTASFSLNLNFGLTWKLSRASGGNILRGSEKACPVEMIGGLPAYSYCMYSEAGRDAYSRFLRSESPIRRTFSSQGIFSPVRALGFLVFQVEGTLLNRELAFEGSREIRLAADSAELMMLGFLAKDTSSLQQLARESLPLINVARDSIYQDCRRQRRLFD